MAEQQEKQQEKQPMEWMRKETDKEISNHQLHAILQTTFISEKNDIFDRPILYFKLLNPEELDKIKEDIDKK